jgi:hypothetical protein
MDHNYTDNFKLIGADIMGKKDSKVLKNLIGLFGDKMKAAAEIKYTGTLPEIIQQYLSNVLNPGGIELGSDVRRDSKQVFREEGRVKERGEEEEED